MVPKPPWLRPRAWSSGSPAGGFFFRGPRRRLVGPDDGAVYAEQAEVDLPGPHLAGLEAAEDLVPQAVAAPLAEAVVGGLPGAEAPREVAPAAAVMVSACPLNCTNDSEFYAFHSGGCNVAFADGSVRYLSQSISITTLAALCTRAGGEVPGSDF